MNYICVLLLLLGVPVYGAEELDSSKSEGSEAVIRNNIVTSDAPIELTLKALTTEQYQYINDIINGTANTRDGFGESYNKIVSFLEKNGLKDNSEYAIIGEFKQAEDIAKRRLGHGRRGDDYLPCSPGSFSSYVKVSDEGRLNERAFACVVSNGYYLSVVSP